MAKLKLLLLADAQAPHTRRWAKWFSHAGLEVCVGTFNSHTPHDYESVPVVPLWSYISRNSPIERIAKTPLVGARLRRLYREFQPDVVHAHSAGGYTWMSTATLPGPLVSTPWGSDLLVDSKRSRSNRRITSAALRRVDAVTTDGAHMIPILKAMGVKDSRILLHQFGTDTHFFAPKPARQASHCLTISSTRTLTEVHDVKTFVSAIPRIAQCFSNVRFVIAGDGPLRNDLEDYVLATCRDADVEFTGMLNECDIRNLLHRTDIYVSTSPIDAGLAGSTAEAMATGLPVIHARVGDNAQWTGGGIGGLLFDPGNYIELATRAIELLGQPVLRHQMGQRNRERIVNDYNVDVEMNKVLDLYLRLKAR